MKFRYSLSSILALPILAAVVLVSLQYLLAPRTFEDFYKRGIERSNDGKYSLAVKDFDRALILVKSKSDSTWWEPHVYTARATANNNQGEYQLAVDDMNYVLDSKEGNYILNPDVELSCRLIRATANFFLNKLELANEDLGWMREHHPECPEVIELESILEEQTAREPRQK